MIIILWSQPKSIEQINIWSAEQCKGVQENGGNKTLSYCSPAQAGREREREAGGKCLRSPPIGQEVAAVSGNINRRLPVSDYNLWSISIIGGVCRDSYSNNYQDWSVS